MVKNVNRIEPRKKPRRLRIRVPSQIRRIFNYKCYITFLTGFYSCHWGFRQWEKTELGSCCCSRREQVFFVFLVISFSLSAATLFVWVETSNEYFDFDWVTYLGTKRWFFWSIFILSLAGIMVAYTSLLLVVTFLLLRERIELYLHTCHKVFICLLILLCVFLLVILSKFWQDKWMIVGLSLRIFAPYVHLCSIVLMSLISWPLAFYVSHLEAETLQVAAGLPFAILLLCLYLLPLGVYSPCILKKEDLAPRPLFVAHRGAPMAAPENTMMSFQKAVEFGTYALETDVYLSYDKVSFLMHDFDLSRTTNIREVMPSAAYETPAAFYWNFLKTLNAGKWFVEQMPYYNMKPLSEADKRRARNQSIPRLVDLLEFAKKEKKFLIFDLFRPPPSHPLRGDFIQHVVEEILKSKIEQHLILWLPNQERDYVQRAAPGFQQVGRLNPVHRLVKENISKINVDYKTLFYNGMKEYKDANININLYLVNEPWLFSLAWCSRINSVTTDNIPVLSQLNYPYFFMTPGYYTCMWLLVDFTSAVLVALVCCFHWWKEAKKERRLEVCSIAPGSTNLKEKGDGPDGPRLDGPRLAAPPHDGPRLTAPPPDGPRRVADSPWVRSTSPQGSRGPPSAENPKPSPEARRAAGAPLTGAPKDSAPAAYATFPRTSRRPRAPRRK